MLTTSAPPSQEVEGVLRRGPALARHDAEHLTLQSERIAITVASLAPVRGEAVHRLLLIEREPAVEGESLIVFERA